MSPFVQRSAPEGLAIFATSRWRGPRFHEEQLINTSCDFCSRWDAIFQSCSKQLEFQHPVRRVANLSVLGSVQGLRTWLDPATCCKGFSKQDCRTVLFAEIQWISQAHMSKARSDWSQLCCLCPLLHWWRSAWSTSPCYTKAWLAG